MPKMEFKNKLNIDDTLKDIQKLKSREWPQTIAVMFSHIAGSSQDAAQSRTREQYNLHTEYIPNGIRAVPLTTTQINKSAKSLAKYYDMFAAVYLRGSPDPKKSLEFMAQHEEGYTRRPHKQWASLDGQKYLAQPGPADHHDESKVKNKRGKIRERFKPSDMLKKFEASGSEYDHEKKTTITRKFNNRRGRNKAKIPGGWFIISPNGDIPAIARRTSRGSEDTKGDLQIMWWLTKEQKIDNDYRFEKTVMERAKQRYPIEAKRMVARIKL